MQKKKKVLLLALLSMLSIPVVLADENLKANKLNKLSKPNKSNHLFLAQKIPNQEEKKKRTLPNTLNTYTSPLYQRIQPPVVQYNGIVTNSSLGVMNGQINLNYNYYQTHYFPKNH